VTRAHRLIGLLALTAAAVAGCGLGRTAEEFPVARSPEGIRVSIITDSADVRQAELLAVEDTALLIVLADNRIAYVPWSVVRSAELHGFLSDEPRRNVPSQAMRARWKSVARFPQGLTAEQLARLLDARGQTTAEVLR
jgi:hypothetical protein